MAYFSWFDLIYSLLLTVFFYQRAKSKNVDKKYGKYYHQGLFAKLLATYLFCFIYMFYYQGGDTINYYRSALCFFKMFWQDFDNFWSLFTGGADSLQSWLMFDANTGWPDHYMFKDSRTFLVLQFTTLLMFPGLGGFMATSVIIANISYKAVWKGYTFVVDKYPKLTRELAICFLFLPSTIFWGSGIMKDTFTFASVIYAIYAINAIVVEKKRKISIIASLLVSIYLIINIKAYILFALLPGIIIFFNFERISKIKNRFVKLIVTPLIVGVFFLIGQGFFLQLGDEFGKYSADRILEEAVLQQKDLSRAEAYGENYFDIGEFEPTLTGVLSKAHLAINAALFRPYLWEVGSPTMLFSAVENSILFCAVIYFIFKIGFLNIIRELSKDGFLIFCFSFSIILAFGVGLSTANFGALVRYKIPFLPFVSALFFILHHKIGVKKDVLS